METEAHDFDKLRALEDRLKAGDRLQARSETVELVRRVGSEVGLSAEEVERQLGDEGGLEALVLEERRRIHEGNHRLMRAISEAGRLVTAGDPDAARQVLMAIVEEEPVLMYRREALGQMKSLGLR